jgi:hypothetical protein
VLGVEALSIAGVEIVVKDSHDVPGILPRLGAPAILECEEFEYQQSGQCCNGKLYASWQSHKLRTIADFLKSYDSSDHVAVWWPSDSSSLALDPSEWNKVDWALTFVTNAAHLSDFFERSGTQKGLVLISQIVPILARES